MAQFVHDPGNITGLHAEFISGTCNPAEFLEGLFKRIDEVEPQIQGWCGLDRADALDQAQRLGEELRRQGPRSVLHGIPVAIKDVIDVRGFATRAGSKTRRNQAVSTMDADIVSKLRAAGALIMGKTHTTEFAYFEGVPPTRNPFHIGHTPGGSSGGPAAAVASGMAVASLGTQTAGSVVRPAAYCGIAAFKPTTQGLSAHGVVPLAPSFDTVGWFGYRTEDVCAIAESLRFHAGSLITNEAARTSQRIAILNDPLFFDAPSQVASSIEKAAAQLRDGGHQATAVQSPESLTEVLRLHRGVLEFELARVHGHLLKDGKGVVTEAFLEAIERGLAMDEQTYQLLQWDLLALRQRFWQALEGFDAVIAPASTGTAPAGEGTGDPRYIIPFTALAGPIVTVPVRIEKNGLPLGIMISSPPWSDRRLLRSARHIAEAIEMPRDIQALLHRPASGMAS